MKIDNVYSNGLWDFKKTQKGISDNGDDNGTKRTICVYGRCHHDHHFLILL